MENVNKKNGFNWLMFKRLWSILKIIFPKWCSISTTLFSFLLIISFLEQYVGYEVGLIASRYYKVLGDRNFEGFLYTTATSTLLVLAISLVLTTKEYVANILYITWRQLLCHDLHKLYFSGMNYYILNVIKKILDNPDQRMTQDVDRLCHLFSIITIIIIIAPFKISYYTYKTYEGTGWIGPVGVFVFFCVGTVLNKLIMSPIVKYIMEQEKREGDFRFKHMHIRVNSESVAFHVSGSLELEKANTMLNRLIRIQRTVFNKEYWLNLVKNAYNYLGAVVSYCVIAIPIFNGAYDGIDSSDLSSLISKNSFLCITLMYSFSQLVSLTSSVVELAGVTHRVFQLLDQLGQLQEQWDLQVIQVSSSFTNLIQNYNLFETYASREESRNLLEEHCVTEPTIINKDEESIKVAFILKNVTITTPETERILIKDINLDICKNQNLMIMGSSSSGKSSLLRVMRGLWEARSGTVAHNLPPGPKVVIFLPQKPLMTNGSLFEQIIYPLRVDTNHPPSKDVCNAVTEQLNKLLLDGLLQRCGGLLVDPNWNWDNVLSPGEMQRICFLRIFYHRPQFAFLDESTSALSLDVEDLLYSECLRLGITLVSVGHRISLKKYHNVLLTLSGDGSWTLEDLVSQDASSEDVSTKSSVVEEKLD